MKLVEKLQALSRELWSDGHYEHSSAIIDVLEILGNQKYHHRDAQKREAKLISAAEIRGMESGRDKYIGALNRALDRLQAANKENYGLRIKLEKMSWLPWNKKSTDLWTFSFVLMILVVNLLTLATLIFS